MVDSLIFSFDNEDGEPAICVMRKTIDDYKVLKIEIGEQADILYHLLTEQTLKAITQSVINDIRNEIDMLEESEMNSPTSVTIFSWEYMKKQVFKIIDEHIKKEGKE